MEELHFGYTPTFMKEWERYGLGKDDLDNLESDIISFYSNPPANNGGKKFPGDIVSGVSGAYKLRFSSDESNKGKSGSYRTLYVVVTDNNIYFLDIFAKSDKGNISNSEKRMLKSTIAKLRKWKK